ncbi:MAG: DUF58 domain-containing protein [Chloroflexi bacterium]|nr:MAG: DUF58 domain-containing protein [Chloroflexota bacterium]
MDDAGWVAAHDEGSRPRQLLILAVFLVLVALAIQQPVLVLLGLLCLLVVLAALLWRRFGLRGVTYGRTLSAPRAFPGDELILELTLENRKLLPLPWLEVVDEFPKSLTFLDVTVEPSTKPRVVVFRSLFTLGSYQRVRRRYRFRCTARGSLHFGPALIKTGDVFGLAKQETEMSDDTALLVYPRLLSLPALGLPAADPFGDTRPRRFLLEDPLQPASVRPYVAGDAPRRIHWRASARTMSLQSREYERTALPTIAIFLDVNTFEHFWEGVDPQRLELAISAAASLAARGLAERRQVGLYVNAPMEGGERFVRIRPSRHPRQLARLLEALALLVPYSGFRIEALLEREVRVLPPGLTLVVVTSLPTPALEETLARLYRGGHSITLLVIGTRPDLPERNGFRVYALGSEVPVADLDTFELA